MKNILILSDNKAGHYNQCLAITDNLSSEYKSILYSVNYKRDINYIILSCLSLLLPSKMLRLQPEILFKLINEPQLKKLIESNEIVAVISAGALVEPLNYLIGQIYGIKKILVMKPNILSYKNFDLCITYDHENINENEKVIKLLCAPGKINPKLLNEKSKMLKDTLGLNKSKFIIGVLVGGESKRHYLTKEFILLLLKNLESFCNEVGGIYLLTTSRRTGKEIDDFIFNNYNKDICPYLLLASRDSYNPVAEILGLCNIPIVTDDSISMISECVASEKFFIILNTLRKQKKEDKFTRFYNNLKEKGFAEISTIENIQENLKKFYNEIPAFTPINVSAEAARKIEQLLKS